ncbi:hypothetical protein PV04_06020 [Phialophora macrospora]|uniref:Amino acid permease/ SLC12A domain-containing protein n=1 Tax=Phialophora macrospora TaxID=1851006 RepID=A0A0D2CNB1_9EURO|nr:hypothetical protein PV04_06020 [Phialophora macrospora]
MGSPSSIGLQIGSGIFSAPAAVHHTVTKVQGSVVSLSGFSEIWVSFGGFVESIYAAAFAVGGWESLGFVGGEIQDPDITLPRILKAALSLVITLFLCSNLALYTTVPADTLKETDAPALVG